VAVALLPAAVAAALAAAPLPAQTSARTLKVGTVERSYLLHLPPHLPRDGSAALILAFHGRGGDGAGMERLTRFSDLADRDGFAVAYPDGLDRSWNDGRSVPAPGARRSDADDVGFISLLIDSLTTELHPDPRRIFATGFSNGAGFSHYLAARLSTRIAAIASVSGGISDGAARHFSPMDPVSVLIIQGTADPLVPYAGGPVSGGRLGRELGADSTALLWEESDGIRAVAATGELADVAPGDRCRVHWERWSGGRRGTEIRLYRLEGGGHTWPGGPQYLPRGIVGPVCRDFDATAAIWDFFAGHAKAPPRVESP
jgi:polyhydroxybutyrate depolymerase